MLDIEVSSYNKSSAKLIGKAYKLFCREGKFRRATYSRNSDRITLFYYKYRCSLHIVFSKMFHEVVLYTRCNENSYTIMIFSFRVLSILEFVAGYYKIIFGGEVSLRYMENIDPTVAEEYL